jgi:hypothetical protein
MMGSTSTANKGKKSKHNFGGETSFAMTMWKTVEEVEDNIQVVRTTGNCTLGGIKNMFHLHIMSVCCQSTCNGNQANNCYMARSNRGLDKAFNDTELTHNVRYVIIPVIFSK